MSKYIVLRGIVLLLLTVLTQCRSIDEIRSMEDAESFDTMLDDAALHNLPNTFFDEESARVYSSQHQTRIGDAVITIAVSPDQFPQEIGFVLTARDGGAVLAQKSAGFLTVKEIYVERVSVSEGQDYILSVTDTFGDGINAPGFVAVYYGSVPTPELEIVRLAGFKTGKAELAFTMQQPITASLSVSPSPTASFVPTHSPTICIPQEADAWQVADQHDYDPHFLTTETALGADQCKSHTNYLDCTNERLQDCQWQFIGSSPRKGVCRIDPVTNCIANGSCMCDTGDFRGGPATMADGILFHASISVTPRDIGPHADKLTYHETYTRPTLQNPAHTVDEDFFISRVDFSNRVLRYDFGQDSPVPRTVDHTIAFKLHYLYWDTPMVGSIWTGVGTKIEIDTIRNLITINGLPYQLPTPLKKWTCTSVIVTGSKLHVGHSIIARQLDQESPLMNSESSLELGPFSGELFDVRIYSGTLSGGEVREFGARCTTPDDPASLDMRRDLEHPYIVRLGCEPNFENLHAGAGGKIPTDSSAGHTYGSGPFATLWLKPDVNPFNSSEYLDVVEGQFDEERYFQQSKLVAYLWERFLYQVDMVAYIQEPYRPQKSADQVPKWSAKYWNNPCRYTNNFNNGWQYPIYNAAIPKWTVDGQGAGVTQFDLGHLYRSQGSVDVWTQSLNFVTHEMFHTVQGNIGDVYSGSGSSFLLESTAEYGTEVAFSATDKIVASFFMAPSYPLGLQSRRDLERAQHFLTDAVSVHDAVRGGHRYASWLLWWFLADHAGLPHLVGEVFGRWYENTAYTAGELFLVRELVENADMDFGDVWATCIAHMRTWDFPRFADEYKAAEKKDFEALMGNPDNLPPIPKTLTLEGRKISAEIDPVSGTRGQLVAGPKELRPGPNGWNCLTMREVASNKYVTIDVKWDGGMGFDDGVKPSYLPAQQLGCDDDPRFYNNVVIAHNEATGKRRYWKLKGKNPEPLSISIGKDGPETIHVLLVPTPPSDYVLGVTRAEDNNGLDVRVSPIPVYSYQYSAQVMDQKPDVDFAAEAEKEFGILKFNSATPGWWPVACTCIEKPEDGRNDRCVRPRFDGVRDTTKNPTATPSPTSGGTPVPTPPNEVPTKAPSVIVAAVPTLRPTEFPTVLDTVIPTPFPSESPTKDPTDAPTMVVPFPSSFPSETPSRAPIIASTPTSAPDAPVANQGDLFITLVIKLDNFPEAISWKLEESVSQTKLHWVDPGAYSGMAKGTITRKIWLDPIDMTYTFTMTDSSNTGITTGSSFDLIRANGEHIAQIDDFWGPDYSVTFSMTGTGMNPSAVTAQPAAPSSFGTGWMYSPTESDSYVILFIQLDDYPEETSWRLVESDTQQAVHWVDPDIYGGQVNKIVTKALWLKPGNKSYEFIMMDTYGDGLIGNGYFELSRGNGEIIARVDDFSSSERIVPFAMTTN